MYYYDYRGETLKIATIEQMRQLDTTAIIEYGILEDILMENAALATYEAIKNEFDLSQLKVLVIAGNGNNGGDGLALARKLHSRSIPVDVIITGGIDRYKDVSRRNYEVLRKFGINIINLEDIDDLESFLAGYNLIADAIFGSGLDRKVEGNFYRLIDAINNCPSKVISLDMPSGINGNTGEVMGISVSADITVTYGIPKIGNILYEGYNYCGKLYYSNISFPEKIYENIETELNLPIRLPERNPNSHKGSFKKVLFIGGGSQYFGAPYLNSVGYLRSGGSYSRLACPQNVSRVLAMKSPEVVYYPMKESHKGNLSIENLKTLLDLSLNMDMLLIGGGFSLEEESQRLAQILITKLECPIVVDADGISALAEKIEILYSRKNHTILTPHLGEMSKLTGLSIEEIEKNPIETAREFAKKYRIILVLKGGRSIIAYPDGKVYINTSGNSALSVAGSGDILTGIIAGQFSLGLRIEDSVRNAVFLHGYTGDLTAEKLGQDGVMAEDILNYLQLAVKNLRSYYELVEESYKIIRL